MRPCSQGPRKRPAEEGHVKNYFWVPVAALYFSVVVEEPLGKFNLSSFVVGLCKALAKRGSASRSMDPLRNSSYRSLLDKIMIVSVMVGFEESITSSGMKSDTIRGAQA